MTGVKNLDGLELDIAVARAEIASGAFDIKLSDAGQPTIRTVDGRWEPFRPTLSWEHAGPIIERDWLHILAKLRDWCGDLWAEPNDVGRAGMLLWLMRAYVASRT